MKNRSIKLLVTLFIMIFCLIPPASAEEMTADQVRQVLTRNNMEVLAPLVTKGKLVLDTKNTTTNVMVLRIPDNKPRNPVDADDARYWYRGMGLDEARNFLTLRLETINWEQKSFVGIAPSFPYVISYLTRENPGVAVEFDTQQGGFLHKEWSTIGKCQAKPENGTRSWGLGISGSISSCKNLAFRVLYQGLGQQFNQWLQANTVQVRVVYVKLPR